MPTGSRGGEHLRAVLDDKGEHTVQPPHRLFALALEQAQHDFGVAPGGEVFGREHLAQETVVVNLSVGDDGPVAGAVKDGLRPAGGVDDGKPHVPHHDRRRRRAEQSVAVGTAMAQARQHVPHSADVRIAPQDSYAAHVPAVMPRQSGPRNGTAGMTARLAAVLAGAAPRVSRDGDLAACLTGWRLEGADHARAVLGAQQTHRSTPMPKPDASRGNARWMGPASLRAGLAVNRRQAVAGSVDETQVFGRLLTLLARLQFVLDPLALDEPVQSGPARRRRYGRMSLSTRRPG